MIFSNYALAQSSFTPAIIGDDPQSLHNLLSFPNVDGDWNALVKCTAQVGESGSVRFPVCFDRDETNSPFFQEVIRSARGSRMIPATVDGVNVFVEMVQFSVLFQQRDEQQAVVVYPHHGNNRQFYGDNYIAAQRYGVTQSADCDARTRSSRFGELNVRMVFSLDANGEVGEEIEAMDETLADCLTAFENFIKKGTYIPAYFEGRPVDSVVVQWFYKRQ
ncbi:MAG: hypothetical protein QGF90_07815 [Gammaproteobacteria bacterium]|nr:hypothetical protein [Gammaproteobacteria bacterium]